MHASLRIRELLQDYSILQNCTIGLRRTCFWEKAKNHVSVLFEASKWFKGFPMDRVTWIDLRTEVQAPPEYRIKLKKLIYFICWIEGKLTSNSLSNEIRFVFERDNILGWHYARHGIFRSFLGAKFFNHCTVVSITATSRSKSPSDMQCGIAMPFWRNITSPKYSSVKFHQSSPLLRPCSSLHHG